MCQIFFDNFFQILHTFFHFGITKMVIGQHDVLFLTFFLSFKNFGDFCIQLLESFRYENVFLLSLWSEGIKKTCFRYSGYFFKNKTFELFEFFSHTKCDHTSRVIKIHYFVIIKSALTLGISSKV